MAQKVTTSAQQSKALNDVVAAGTTNPEATSVPGPLEAGYRAEVAARKQALATPAARILSPSPKTTGLRTLLDTVREDERRAP